MKTKACEVCGAEALWLAWLKYSCTPIRSNSAVWVCESCAKEHGTLFGKEWK